MLSQTPPPSVDRTDSDDEVRLRKPSIYPCASRNCRVDSLSRTVRSARKGALLLLSGPGSLTPARIPIWGGGGRFQCPAAMMLRQRRRQNGLLAELTPSCSSGKTVHLPPELLSGSFGTRQKQPPLHFGEPFGVGRHVFAHRAQRPIQCVAKPVSRVCLKSSIVVTGPGKKCEQKKRWR